ncbi:MAG: hypothetical protein JWM82_2986 [Myxococcales bacterium]|nr:hypothetical protein [Myxococcales bacterium]
MKTRIIIGASALLLSSAGVAHATHKAWVLRQSGASCQVINPGNTTTDTYRTEVGLYNGYFGAVNFNAVSVQCPVALSGMFGGTSGGTAFSKQAWLAAREAKVWVDAASKMTCKAEALSNTGSELISRSVSSTGSGLQAIVIKQDAVGANWGGTLLNGHPANVTLMALNYTCTLPVGAGIQGHDTKICQLIDNCHS